MGTTREPTSDEVPERDVTGQEPDVPVRRPDPVRWLWYAFGGRLPARYRTWVLHDLTCRTWAVRHIVRALIQVSPVAVALFALIPGSPGVRLAGVVAGLLLGLLYSCAYMYEIAEHRVAQAGYRAGTAHAVREESHWEARQAQAERYARNWRPSVTSDRSE
jgi:hypothetical protein